MPGTRRFLPLLIVLSMTAAARADLLESDLPRAGSLGVQVGPAEGADGAAIIRVFPGSAAAEAGLADGDLVTGFDDDAIADVPGLLAHLADRKEGDKARLAIKRGDEELKIEVTLRGRPREEARTGRVHYGSVDSAGGELRTILTVPEGDGPFPAFFFIQGIGCYSVDNPSGPLIGYRAILDAFAQAGYVTLRVEKPGCGDGEGAPCRDVDFETELDGYRQALMALKACPLVDPDRVLIFGHSMGGTWGPILAAETPVRGVAVYGTLLKSWYEYALENGRRQLLLAGQSDAEVDRILRAEARYQFEVAFNKKTPAEVAEANADLASYINQNSPDGEHMYDRSAAFFHQLHDRNMAEVWSNVSADVLAVWGVADFVSGRDDHERIAAIAERGEDGGGRFVALAESDHGFNRAASFEEAFGQDGPGEFNPAIVELLIGWAAEINPPASPGTAPTGNAAAGPARRSCAGGASTAPTARTEK